MEKQNPAEKANKTKPIRREPRYRKVLRLLAYCSVVALGTGALAARSAYGSVQKSALEMGEELGKLGDVGNKTPLLLNGQEIFVGSTTHDISVSDVLDRVEALCRTDSGNLKEALQHPESFSEQLKKVETRKPALGIVREEDDGARGTVFCFAHERDQKGGFVDSMKRFSAFAESGDVQDLGQLRYVFAKKTPAGRTQVITAWTEGSFQLGKFAPEEGKDTPGSDPESAPRPPGAVRLLTATSAGTPYSVRLYQSTVTTHDVAARYDADMPVRGWAINVADGDRRVYTQGAMAIFVTTTERPSGSLVSVIEMGHKP